MKKLCLVLVAISLFPLCQAQQFSFQMHFRDAVGNRDSITLGYDPAATDSLDAAFGEVNVITTPFSSGLDVRTGSIWFQSYAWTQYGLTAFESKTQIVPEACGGANFWSLSPIIGIQVVSDHFPVTASWDRNLFNGPCSNGSLFTGWSPNGWWDVGPSDFREILSQEDSVSFYQSNHYYIKGTDTLYIYWVALTDSTFLGMGLGDLQQNANVIRTFPNPVKDYVNIQCSPAFGEIAGIALYNSLGQLVYASPQLPGIDMAGFPSGMYLLKVSSKTAGIALHKIFKI